MVRTSTALGAWGLAVRVASDAGSHGPALVRRLTPLAQQLGAAARADRIAPTAAYAMLQGALSSVEVLDADAAGPLRETAVFAYLPDDAGPDLSPARPARLVIDAPRDGLEHRA